MGVTVTPVGTTLTLGSLSLCLVSISSFGWSAVDPIETSCLSNTEYLTKYPATLKEAADISFTCKYNPDSFGDIEAEIQSNQQITIDIPDIGHVHFWGYLSEFTPDEAELQDGWQATGTIVVTNSNDSYVETAPTFTAAS